MIGIGFIGVGGMGMNQARAFDAAPGCRVVAGADPSDAARARFAEAFGKAAVYTDAADLLADGKVDAVVVAPPTAYHAQLSIAAMKAGRPVMVEKPMARTVAECKRMLDTQTKTGQLLMVAQCRRFDTDWGAMAKAVASGRLGSPVCWRSMEAGVVPAPWFLDDKLSGGPLLDKYAHDWDFANLMFGDPVAVYASAFQLSDATGVDTASAIVDYANGHQLVRSICWVVRAGNGFDLLGPKGSLVRGTGDLTPPSAGDAHGYYCLTDLKRKQKLIRFRRRNMYVEQARHFVRCVTGKSECISPGSEAIKAVAVGDAAIRAARKRGSVKIRW